MSRKNVLVVVDMQKDFVDGALGSPAAVAIVPQVAQKIAEARQNGSSIIFTRDTHGADYRETEEGRNLPVPHCLKDTEGWQLDGRLGSAAEDKIVNKETFGSFDLGNYLHENAADIGTIELVGLCTDICVLSNAVVAKTACPNAHILVDAACCAGVSPESHDTALNAMKAIQVEVVHQGQEPWRK